MFLTNPTPRHLVPATAVGLLMCGAALASTTFDVTVVAEPGKTVNPIALGAGGAMIATIEDNQWHAAVIDSAGNIESLHDLPADWISTPRDINASGQVIVDVGIPPIGDGAYTSVPYRYTPGTGLESLLDGLPQATGSLAEMFIADDGSVGVNFWGFPFVSAVYTDAEGWRVLQDLLPLTDFSKIVDMTPDGTVVIHQQGNDNSVWQYDLATGESEQVLFLEGTVSLTGLIANESGMVAGSYKNTPTTWCGFRAEVDRFESFEGAVPAGAFTSGVEAIAPNGAVGGQFVTSDGVFGVFATAGGLVNLAMFPGEIGASITGVNSEGVTVGGSHDPSYSFTGFAMAADGSVINLQDVLAEAGHDFFQVMPVDIDDEGRIIARAWTIDGFNTQVGLILTPAPACPADLTGDNSVDSADLNEVLSGFGSTTGGDINGDGVTDSADLNIVLGAFGAACEN